MNEEYGDTIPNFLNAEAFITARLKELSSLTTAIGENKKVTTIFQRLPRHMRRRAMSHTIKRVPRNLRDSHKRQLEKNNALKKPKKARKRYRKRPKQLLLEYNRRQNTKTWLETHIWHAKRFRMCTKWNYKLAESSYEKTFRSVYRATTSHCLLQDISYYSCIELNGYLDTLIDGFKSITSSTCGLSIKAKCWSSGCREGSITLFHVNSYPYNVIGNVNFMWRPQTIGDVRTLWVWCHPSVHEEIVKEFIKVFSLSSVNANKNNEIKDSIVDSMLRFPTYKNISNKVTLLLLKSTLNRLRLTGPLSNAVLTKALHPAEIYNKVLNSKDNWWSKWRQKEDGSGIALELLNKYPQPFLFPPHVIMGCNIVDPRLFLKRLKSKAIPESEGCDYCESIPPNLVTSAIWEAEVRQEVSARKLPVAKLDVLRSELLVSGFDEQLLKTVNSVIPVLLVQRPGTTVRGIKSNYGCGWDIILPSNWAMPVWLSLILCGARAGGLRETRTIDFESQKPPEMSPDSKCGKEYYVELKSRCEDLYFKKPSKKRTNYIKYGVPNPFYHNWELLTKQWSNSESDNSYYVLRDRRLLQQVQEYIFHFKSSGCSRPNISLPSNSLIPIMVTLLGKGQLAAFSHICMPSESDLQQRKHDLRFAGPSEKLHPDVFKQKRKALKKEHAKELKRLRRKRIKEKKERMQAGLPLKITKRKNSPTSAEVRDYLNRMRELWIPTELQKLRTFCVRDICGFVVVSGFSFLRSSIIGQGYVTGESLMMLFQLTEKLKCDSVLLTRSPNSLNYRFCKIDIIVE